MTTLRLPKITALRFAVKVAPLYAELLQELKADGGRLSLQSRIALVRQKVGSYVTLYDDERKLGVVMFKGLLGDQAFDEINREVATLTEEEQMQLLVEFAESGELEELAEAIVIPQTEEEWIAAENAVNNLPPEEKALMLRQGALFWAGVFGGLFNTLSLMVHGVKLTVLVPLALSGDDEALLKAVQIDRCLMTHHPYFLARKQKAQDLGEDTFLRALAYRECNPPLRGPIRYPGLFMLLGTLQLVQWLHELRHAEILDLCEQAGLERYQNRIEDVGYVTKRVGDFYRWQKTGGVSMH